MKKNIGLATCYIDNFGACLQAYALQSKIEEAGFDCEIINYTAPSGYYKNTLKRRIAISPIFSKLLFKIRKQHIKIYGKAIKFNMFRKKYLKLSKELPNFEAVKEYAVKYSSCVCGSDQIWNPKLFNGNDKVYLLDFLNSNQKRIAYAPSIGLNDFPDQHIDEFCNLISKFGFLSVRENSAKEIIESNSKLNVKVVLDPTLLLNSKDWSLLVKGIKFDKPYIFLYIFGEKRYIGEFVEYISKKLDMQVVCIPFTSREEESDFIKVNDVGPSEFLGLIKNASLVITDSFHATAFSINFNIPFYSLLRNDDKDKINMNSRIFNILELTHLTDRLVEPDVNYPFNINLKMDFSKANLILESRRNEDFNLLKEALEG